MSKKFTIEDVLNRAVAVEKTAESFYRLASKRFEGTDMQILLLQLAEEEEGHQADVNDIKNKYSKDIQLNAVVEIDGETKFLDRFEEIANQGNMQAVAKFALEMEKAAVANYNALANQSSGEIKKVFVDLVSFEQAHVDQISRLIKDLSIDVTSDLDELHAH